MECWGAGDDAGGHKATRGESRSVDGGGNIKYPFKANGIECPIILQTIKIMEEIGKEGEAGPSCSIQ